MLVKTIMRRKLPAFANFVHRTKLRARRLAAGNGLLCVFDAILRDGRWGTNESVSGPGSNLTQTAVLRRELPRLLRRIGAKSMLDAPCGDWFWMRHVDLSGIEYLGADIAAAMVDSCRARFNGIRLI